MENQNFHITYKGGDFIADLRETVWEHTDGDETVTFSSSECKWINKIQKLKEQAPDRVVIQHINDDGSIVAHLPVGWFKIAPPKKVNMTDEQKLAAKQRLVEARKKKQNK